MFLSVYTPTFRRPTLLAQCQASVAAQSVPVEHVIVEDTVGVGVDGMFAAIESNKHLVHGDYVQVLSDDNILTDPTFAADLEQETAKAGFPDVVMFKGQIDSSVQPVEWRTGPVITKVDLSCFAVARPVWQDNADRWGHRYEGDFDFIRALWDAAYTFHWWDRLVFRALQISRGQAEAA